MSLPPPLSADRIAAFRSELSNWKRFGDEDQLGTLNLIDEPKRAAAAASVRSGRCVSCARPLPTEVAPDNRNPVEHRMIATGRDGWGGDYFGLAPHGYATSHIDALCHIFHEGRIYNGHSVDTVAPDGAEQLAIHHLRDGVVSRGVLLDIPRARGVPYLEKGAPIFVADLERAEQNAALRVETGDILLVRTGRWALRAAEGAWNPGKGMAGLDASCLPWLHERGVAALGCDGVSDVMPSRIPEEPMPIHSVAIVTMGLHLIDNLELEDLAVACEAEGRWEFLLTIAPLVLERGTASPVNPIALF